MKNYLRILLSLFIILIISQDGKAQVSVEKNLTTGVNLLKPDGSNLSINFSLTLPPNTSSVTIELENSDSVNNITPYTINFSTQPWTIGIVGLTYNCTKGFGNTLSPNTANSFAAQTLNAASQNYYSCPSSPTNKLGVQYITTGVLGSLSVYAIVNTNGLNLTSPPITLTGGAPTVINATDNGGTTRALKACIEQSGTGCAGGSANYGLSIGANGNTTSSALSGSVTTANATGLPLAVFSEYLDSQINSTAAPSVGQGTGQGSTTQNQRGLLVQNGGYFLRESSFGVTVGQDRPFFSPPGVPAFKACRVDIQITPISGTTPTLNAFFQTSIDGTNWTDRISFTQVTTVASNQWSAITDAVGQNPTVYASGALAQTTRIDGVIGYYGRIHYVTGGTTPSYTVIDAVLCN